MSPEKEEVIRKAAKRYAEACLRVESVGAEKTMSDPEARIRQTTRYHIAEAERSEAYAELCRVKAPDFQPPETTQGA